MGETIASKSADNIRILAAAMVEKARSGHPGGAMGGADFIHILYSEFLNYDPEDMDWKNRDRFFLDPGHMSPMLYAVLSLAGFYTMNDLKSFRQWGSTTPGHPEVDVLRGVENTSGPLGQGHVMAVGAAIAERFLVARFGEWMAHKTYTFISDGGVQEEISQGAGRIAGHLGLHNLIMFYDSNDIQLSTKTTEVTSEETAKKYEAWGWNVMTINGNSAEEIRAALKKAHQEKEKPTLIIGRTIMGKGAVKEDGSSFEMQISTHGMPLGDAGASFSRTIINLGGNPENPFVIFEDVAEKYAGRKKELLSQAIHGRRLVWADRLFAVPQTCRQRRRCAARQRVHHRMETMGLLPGGGQRRARAGLAGRRVEPAPAPVQAPRRATPCGAQCPQHGQHTRVGGAVPPLCAGRCRCRGPAGVGR